MFRFVVLLLAFGAFAVPARAQLIRGYGIKAGLTAANVRSPDLNPDSENPIRFDTVRRYGVAALAYAEWLNLSFLSIVTEGGYVQRGYAMEHEVRDLNNNPAGTARFDWRFDYLSFAAQAKLRAPGGVVAPYVTGGPRLDVYLGGSPGEDGSLAAAYSPTAFGVTAGVGVEAAQLLPVAVFGEVRYNVDFTNSLPDDVPRDAYNNALDVLVGVRL
ncbi:MAG TPA: outer membrane beta-barrel protein [Rhodothermales bacterium]|nr:outer membrane beta-barrel protein [Rhodothermales bacterium]